MIHREALHDITWTAAASPICFLASEARFPIWPISLDTDIRDIPPLRSPVISEIRAYLPQYARAAGNTVRQRVASVGPSSVSATAFQTA